MIDTAWQSQDICECVWVCERGEMPEFVSANNERDELNQWPNFSIQNINHGFDDAIHWLKCQSINLIIYFVCCLLCEMPLPIFAHSIICLFAYLLV